MALPCSTAKQPLEFLVAQSAGPLRWMMSNNCQITKHCGTVQLILTNSFF